MILPLLRGTRELKAEAAGANLFDLRGELPSRWTDVDFQIHTAGQILQLPALLADTGNGVPTRVALPFPSDGRLRCIVRLPERVKALRLELSANGDPRFGPLRVREIPAAEIAMRLAVNFLRQRLAQPRVLPTVARKLIRTLWTGGPTEVLDTLLRKRGSRVQPASYGEWVARYAAVDDADRAAIRAATEALRDPPRFSILMPVHDGPERFLRRAIESVRAQLYPYWELCIADDASRSPHIRQVLKEAAASDRRIKTVFRAVNGHISAASNSALELATGDWVALLDHYDELTEHALYMLAIEAHEADLIYSDEDKLDGEGTLSDPHFKPDWNPELLLSYNYIAHLCAIRTATVRKLGGFRIGFEGSQDHDLVLRVAKTGARIRHVPHVLYHWRAIKGLTALSSRAKEYAEEASLRALREHTGVPVERGTRPLTYHVRWRVPEPPPLVSLIIPTRDARELLETCIASLVERTEYRPYEILIIDNQSRDPRALCYLEELQQRGFARVLRYDEPFNYSAVNNYGVRNARGAIVGLLNNDLEVVDANWLGEMVGQAVRPEIGAVGAKLLYPDRTVQHGGVILGVGAVAGHAHKHLAGAAQGYFSRAQITQNFSAVTAACLLIRREIYERVGGLDESLAVAFNDVDFCLRVREAGYRNVWTPHAVLVHHESKTRGPEDTAAKRDRFRREGETMLARWGDFLRNDPAYNPNLTLESEDFALAWPPRGRKPWE